MPQHEDADCCVFWRSLVFRTDVTMLPDVPPFLPLGKASERVYEAVFMRNREEDKYSQLPDILDDVYGPGAQCDVHICGVRSGGSTLRIAAVSRTDDKSQTFRKVLINTGET
jgi:hypothetical protein